MPELPEVEVVKRSLENKIKNLIIKSVKINDSKLRYKIDNEVLNFLYKNYSKLIPVAGKYIVGSAEPYEYLINSINSFYNQKELSELMVKNGFLNVEYRNLSNGISAIHSGWKI